MSEDSEFIEHVPCEACGSSDANSLYTDGHQFCFACQAYVPGEGQAKRTERKPRMANFIPGEIRAVPKRKITEETCKKFSYRHGEEFGKTIQVADYYDPEGKAVVFQKVRAAGKVFRAVGDMKAAGLYGQHLWRDKGKKVVVTEGEIDCLTVSQLQDNKWPVVSVPNGAAGAKKALQRSLEWLLGFDEIILFFDNDQEGHKAVEECAPLFPPGRCKVARMDEFKDANEAHLAGKSGLVIDSIWGAKTYRPDGIVGGDDLWAAMTTSKKDIRTVLFPWDSFNEKTRGLRRKELLVLTSGSGMGKSAVVRELALHLLHEGETVGMLMLEEDKTRTIEGLIGLELNRPIHLDMTSWDDLAPEEQAERRRAFEAIGGATRLYAYDHFGSTDIDNLLARVRYLAVSCECGWIILDHLSIVVSGMEDGDERKTIDLIMTKLRMIVEETGVGLLLVSHLKRPPGDKGHENGAATSLSQLRGSHAIAQLADMVIGLERDQQGEDPNLTTARILKNRFTGQTGIAGFLRYSPETGRLTESAPGFTDGNTQGFEEETAAF